MIRRLNTSKFILQNIAATESPVGFDADKVEKIVSNILFNAFKFTSAGGRVIFSMYMVHDQDSQVVITVADTGKGIPAEEQSNIFSPFYQLKYNSEDNHPGTGLGLSLVNELIKLYNGTVNLTSEPDKGTSITVVLPLFEVVSEPDDSIRYTRQQNSVTIVEHDEDQPANSVSKKADRILVVEDNTALRNFIASGFVDQFTILSAKMCPSLNCEACF